MTEERIVARGVTGWHVEAGPGGSGGIIAFNTAEGPSAFHLVGDDISRLAGAILNLAAKLSQTVARPVAGSGHLTAVPIPIQAIGLQEGSHGQEVLLVLRSGNLDLTFSVDSTMLVGSAREIVDRAIPLGERSRPS